MPSWLILPTAKVIFPYIPLRSEIDNIALKTANTNTLRLKINQNYVLKLNFKQYD